MDPLEIPQRHKSQHNHVADRPGTRVANDQRRADRRTTTRIERLRKWATELELRQCGLLVSRDSNVSARLCRVSQFRRIARSDRGVEAPAAFTWQHIVLRNQSNVHAVKAFGDALRRSSTLWLSSRVLLRNGPGLQKAMAKVRKSAIIVAWPVT